MRSGAGGLLGAREVDLCPGLGAHLALRRESLSRRTLSSGGEHGGRHRTDAVYGRRRVMVKRPPHTGGRDAPGEGAAGAVGAAAADLAGSASACSLPKYSGISTPPMSFMMCIIGGSAPARRCRKPAVALVPSPVAAVPHDDLVELDVGDRLRGGLARACRGARASASGRPAARRRSPRRCASGPRPSWPGSRTRRAPRLRAWRRSPRPRPRASIRACSASASASTITCAFSALRDAPRARRASRPRSSCACASAALRLGQVLRLAHRGLGLALARLADAGTPRPRCTCRSALACGDRRPWPCSRRRPPAALASATAMRICALGLRDLRLLLEGGASARRPCVSLSSSATRTGVLALGLLRADLAQLLGVGDLDRAARGRPRRRRSRRASPARRRRSRPAGSPRDAALRPIASM